MIDDRGPLDLTYQIEEKDLRLAKEIDRLNEYVQEMELQQRK